MLTPTYRLRAEGVKKIGILLLYSYAISVVVAEVFFVAAARFSCVKDNGWTGFFWCPDSLVATFVTSFFKALVWPSLDVELISPRRLG